MTENRLFRHIKTNKIYVVLNDHAIIEKTLERAVCYHRLYPTDDPITHRVWIRPYDEFMDGRFRPIKLKEDVES